MSYLVICSFDLKDGSYEDYRNAYSDLMQIGLKTSLEGEKGKVKLPTTTTAGSFNGTSCLQVSGHVLEKVKQAFVTRGFSSEIFISVGNDWAWNYSRT